MSRLVQKQAWTSEDDGILIFTLDKNNRIEVRSKLEERQAWEFENGRILVFALDKKYRVASSANKARFHLTLVFDDHDGRILVKHSLVRIR